jgi:hypothetical protein
VPTCRRIDQPVSKAAHITSTHSEITSRSMSTSRLASPHTDIGMAMQAPASISPSSRLSALGQAAGACPMVAATSRSITAHVGGIDPGHGDGFFHGVAAEGLAQFLVDHRLDERGLAVFHLVLRSHGQRSVSSSMVRA